MESHSKSLTLLEKMNQAELTAITPLTLLTNPYASKADIPSLLNDSLLNFFRLNIDLTLDRNDSDFIDSISEVVNESLLAASFCDVSGSF